MHIDGVTIAYIVLAILNALLHYFISWGSFALSCMTTLTFIGVAFCYEADKQEREEKEEAEKDATHLAIDTIFNCDNMIRSWLIFEALTFVIILAYVILKKTGRWTPLVNYIRAIFGKQVSAPANPAPKNILGSANF